ncbi:DNA polymerase-3 subunit gamma/tau [Robiginitalea myxolifaciens]|uniref:DNA polymerase III subunit gamma/tau n=1 Tax=Robiginitalea myxolifaciens TaxID=400055 RepID=A0A1I6H3S5_9FLAO|nr:DNA polymerase III subunit gamma/tau [Robiginitalea myxolifaciens]SFR49059.1 DNA polymerase-3 subunit gamma/tau [Robiginitalea myxolifaciens]
MEPFIVSARKYRPQQFKDVVGQQAITQTLNNAIENDHLAQALLFCGPRGVGKTTCARILAKKINEDGTHQEGEDFAFNIFELDAASNNSVDDIRNLIDQVRIPPQVGKYKVYIIDEVHMLSQNAFNAFLKTLEEPPKHAIFILATTEKHKIIPTILSRCQIFDFRRITASDAAEYLQYIAREQGIEAEEEALMMIAQKADGAMRDALSIFDRVVSFAGKQLTRKAVAENLNLLDIEVYFRTTELILQEDIPGLLVYFNEILSQGFEGQHYIAGLASHFRNLMVCRHDKTVEILEVTEQTRDNYRQQAKMCSDSFLIRATDLANQCGLDYKSSKNQRLLVELCLMKLASLSAAEKKKPGEDHFLSEKIEILPASSFTHKPASPSTPSTPSSTEVAPTSPPVQDLANPGIEVQEAESQPVAHTATAAVTSAEPTASAAVTSEEPTASAEVTAVNSTPSEPIAARPEVMQADVAREKPAVVPTTRKQVSGLSLSGLRERKAHQARKMEVTSEEVDLPKDPVEEEELLKYWEAYIAKVERKGRKILASNLNADSPKLKGDDVIWIELPNSTMKKEVEREQQDLMRFLRKKLNHYGLNLKITVNEEVAKQFAFTPQEKYEKLREKNPAIDLLRKTFDLEL